MILQINKIFNKKEGFMQKDEIIIFHINGKVTKIFASEEFISKRSAVISSFLLMNGNKMSKSSIDGIRGWLFPVTNEYSILSYIEDIKCPHKIISETSVGIPLRLFPSKKENVFSNKLSSTLKKTIEKSTTEILSSIKFMNKTEWTNKLLDQYLIADTEKRMLIEQQLKSLQ